MKKHIQFITLIALVLNVCFMQGQETSISKSDVLAKQISELEAQKNFIIQSACPIREDEVKQYEVNFELLLEVLNLATLVHDTPTAIDENSIIEQKEKTINYQSTNISKVIVERHSTQVSMAGFFSDNSSIKIGSKLFTETFIYNAITFKARYRLSKNKSSLISLEAIYQNKSRVYIDLLSMPALDIAVYNTTEYGSEFKEIQVYFDSLEMGKIRWIETPSYELYLEDYYEAVKDSPNRKIRKYRYAIRCYDDERELITPIKVGDDIAIKPTTHLLWYEGFIGKYPIKMMLKRGFNKETNDERILNIAYGYDSKEKWIHLQSLWEPQDGIYGYEKNDDSPEWGVHFEYNQILKGDWDNQSGTILPITLTPLAKILPEFTFKAKTTNQLTPSGEVSDTIIKGITVYRNQEEIQYIPLSEGYTIDYLELGYVDMNYDGYLDLFIDNTYYIYKAATKRFDLPTDNEPEYYSYLTELSQYNLFTKGFTISRNRSMIEYRANKGQITPYHASSYYPDQDGNMVMLEEKFEKGKWVTIEERIESMEDEETSYADEVDIASPKNYALVTDLTCYDGKLYFSPNFYNNTGIAEIFKQPSKLFVEVTDANGVMQQQYLYDVTTGNRQEDMLDDAPIRFNGENYVLDSSRGLLPFFPLGIKNGDYTYRLKLEQPLFGEVYSIKQKITLPLALDKDPDIIHLTGTINNTVKGDLYLAFNDSTVSGSFINTKTDQRIKLKGEFITGFFGVDSLNLSEYEKEDELSGYFEGEYKDGVYKGYWLSTSRKTKVPFEFKQ